MRMTISCENPVVFSSGGTASTTHASNARPSLGHVTLPEPFECVRKGLASDLPVRVASRVGEDIPIMVILRLQGCSHPLVREHPVVQAGLVAFRPVIVLAHLQPHPQ